MNAPAPDVRERFLRRRLWVRRLLAMLLLAVASFSFIDHLGAFGYRGDDWAKFDQKKFTVREVLRGDRMILDDDTPVQLLAVVAPDLDKHFRPESLQYSSGRLTGKTVLLRLEPTQTRSADGNLLAYVYLDDRDMINVDIIRDGRAYADRRHRHTFKMLFESTENESRKKSRGLWKDITDDQMPAWRLAWLKSLRKPSTQR